MSQNTNYFEDWAVVSVYSRSDALKDGVLIDVSEQARECGFKFPVAVTNTVWSNWIEVGAELEEVGQSAQGRLWDVLNVLFFTIRKLPKGVDSSRIKFRVLFLMNANGSHYAEPELIAVCEPGDNMEPTITIMVEEDE